MVALGPAGPRRLVDVVTTAAKAGKGTPDILEIEAAEAMAQRFSILESVDIPAGAIGTSPLRPEGHPAHQASIDVASLPLESSDDASPAILNYVKRTRASLVIDNAVRKSLLLSVKPARKYPRSGKRRSSTIVIVATAALATSLALMSATYCCGAISTISLRDPQGVPEPTATFRRRCSIRPYPLYRPVPRLE